ncbi:MAG: Fe-S protein assembly chaperone HscA [Magnetococcales bacterium]|nr:Fe-S protein assembly chaperone HscA [Magnetococcales bacterium]
MDVLLDIAEPGEAAKPHDPRPEDQRRVVGIDLGTTFSLAAAIDQKHKPRCIPDEKGRCSLPSVVYFDPKEGENGVTVGHSALALGRTDPQHTVASVKRLMGRGLGEIEAAELRLPYALEASDGGMVRLKMQHRHLSPVEVSAEILKHLKQRAEAALGGSLYGAVVTVPAYFDEAQRQATKDAGKLAGLNVLRLVNEPTAAALAYGLEQEQEGTFAIYDLGGGTFDISILKLSKGVFQVLSTGGDAALGGDDFDHALMEFLLKTMGQDNPDPGLIQTALHAARQAKEALTETQTTTITLPLPDGSRFHHELTRDAFDGLIKKLVRATGLPCRRALKDAGLKPQDLKGVVLVGGSTRVPLVRQFVADLFKQAPYADLDPDQVVALGAAHQADLLAGNDRSGLLLLDVTPLSLGLETMGGMVEKVIPRNSPVPTARAQEFTTFKDGQSAMAIHVVQGEREMVNQCRSLARFELRGIPPMTAGAARIKITFQVDADGLLTVAAREETTGVEQSIEVKPSYGLTDDEIETMLRDALEHGEADVQSRLVSEARVDAERVIHAIESALKQDGDLLNPEERAGVDQAIETLRQVAQLDDHQAIQDQVQSTDKATTFFAQRRMDRNVRAAMTGHKVDDFA